MVNKCKSANNESALSTTRVSPKERELKHTNTILCQSRIPSFMTNFLKTNAEGKSVLEYGCGTGSLINLLLGARAQKTTGIDISEVAIGQAKQKYEKEVATGKVSFQVMDAEALEFADSTFDLICGKSILHHLDLMNTRFYSRTCTWPRNIFNKLNCIIFD
ncbi:MAG: class I SAM-dependent methyltransferase [Caldithrix sp.]|nr:MAG: class I SAM-dependent methyltransferase [Caldithrix sp.]